jgi:hypothetical protein
MVGVYNKLTKFLHENLTLSDLPIIIALVLLVSTPFLLLQNENEIANQIAGYAYYFLIAGILWKIIQYLINRYPHKDNIPTK